LTDKIDTESIKSGKANDEHCKEDEEDKEEEGAMQEAMQETGSLMHDR
jgi:hypothetical protein